MAGCAVPCPRLRAECDSRPRPGGEAIEASRPQPAAGTATADPAPPDTSRPLVRPPFILALILMLAVAAVTAIHLSDTDSYALPNRQSRTESSETRPVDVRSIPSVPSLHHIWSIPTEVPKPALAVVPGTQATDGFPCTPDAGSPVVATVRPVLTARLTVPAPAGFELQKKNATEFVPVDRGDLTPAEYGHVTLYLRQGLRLERGDGMTRTPLVVRGSRQCIAAVTCRRGSNRPNGRCGRSGPDRYCGRSFRQRCR